MLLLAGYFLEENRGRLGLSGVRLSADAQQALLRYDWPGNVRELDHLIGRSTLRALASQRERPRILSLTAADLGLLEAAPSASGAVAEQGSADIDFRDAVAQFERATVAGALARHQNNWATAARALGLDPADLHPLAKRRGLK